MFSNIYLEDSFKSGESKKIIKFNNASDNYMPLKTNRG